MRGLPWCVQSCPRPRGRGGAGGGGGSAASTTDKLPKGWKAVESAQGTYYFNKKTKETRWERPGSPPASSVSADAPPPGTPRSPLGVPPPSSPRAPPAFSVAPPPGPPPGADGRNSLVAAPVTLPGPPPPVAPPPAGGLPEGWEEVATEDGSLYYWNAATGASSWERPA